MRYGILAVTMAAVLAFAGCRDSYEGTGGSGGDQQTRETVAPEYSEDKVHTSPQESHSDDPIYKQPEGTGGADVEGGSPGAIEGDAKPE